MVLTLPLLFSSSLVFNRVSETRRKGSQGDNSPVREATVQILVPSAPVGCKSQHNREVVTKKHTYHCRVRLPAVSLWGDCPTAWDEYIRRKLGEPMDIARMGITRFVYFPDGKLYPCRDPRTCAYGISEGWHDRQCHHPIRQVIDGYGFCTQHAKIVRRLLNTTTPSPGS